jgi:hypothetical protein
VGDTGKRLPFQDPQSTIQEPLYWSMMNVKQSTTIFVNIDRKFEVNGKWLDIPSCFD